MAKIMERVKLADVYPVEDEYGNQFTSRDYSLEANRDYVRELAESMRAKGEPDEPITLVRDGGIYRVATGNSRVMAMRELGTDECWAVIDEDDTPQRLLESVIRTNVKKTYEPVEYSRYVQQLTMFGDDEYVSGVTGIEPGKVRKVRRARKAVDDAGDDMTLDRMYLIAEFADDPEAVEELSSCQERDVPRHASQLRAKREKREKKEAFAAAFALQGVPVVEDREGLSGMAYYVSAPEPAEVAGYLPPEWEDGQVAAYLSETYAGVRAEVYVSPELADDGESEEEAELRRQVEAYAEAIAEMDEARHAWFWANIAEGRPMPSLLREAERRFNNNWLVKDAKGAMTEDAKAAAKNGGLSVYDYAIGYAGVGHSGKRFADALATGELKDYKKGAAAGYLDELALYQEDGWDPGDGHALIAKLSEIVNGKEGGEGDDE